MTKDITMYDKGLAWNTIRMKEIKNYFFFIHLGDFTDNPGVNYEFYIDKLDLLFCNSNPYYSSNLNIHFISCHH